MLSYRHAFHAGNHADVLKHITLVQTLTYLTEKPAPILYVDSHAGAGLYVLSGDMANKTGEYRQGVAALNFAALPEMAAAYQAIIAPYSARQRYPGSPLIAANLLRAQDRLRLFELHPSDQQWLQKALGGDRRVIISEEDGYQGIKASLPGQFKRALVLIDPSYEKKTDYDAVIQAIIEIKKRLPGAVMLLWYPVITRHAVNRLVKAFAKVGIKNSWQFELCVDKDNDDYGMTGSGLLVANTPWTLPAQLQILLPALSQQLGGAAASHRCQQLTGD